MTQTPPPPPGGTPPPPPPPPGGTPPPPGAVPPPPGQPPGFAVPGGPAGAQTDGLAIAALCVAIGGVFFSFACGIGVIGAIVALVLASNSQKKISASGGRLTGEGLNTAARIISWIHIGLAVIGIVILIIVIAAGGFDDDDDDDFDDDFGLGSAVKLVRLGVLSSRAVAGFVT